MAIAEKAKEHQDVREVLASVSRIYQDHLGLGKKLDKFMEDFKTQMKSDMVYLLNEKESLARANHEAAIKIAGIEREAATRMQSVESGHRALVESLTKREIEVGNMKADLEKRELAVNAERHKYELLNEDLSRKIAGLTKK